MKITAKNLWKSIGTISFCYSIKLDIGSMKVLAHGGKYFTYFLHIPKYFLMVAL